EHNDARPLATSGGHDELRLDPVHLGGRDLPGNLAVGEIWDGRRGAGLPCPFLQWAVDAVPHELRRGLAARMAELQADLRGGIVVDEIDDAPPRRFLLVGPEPRATGRYAGGRRDAGHYREDQTGT